MKTIDVPHHSVEINGLLEAARGGDVLIRTSDGSEFVLSAVDEFDLEVVKTRQNERLMELLDARAARESTVSLAEAKRQLGL